MEKPAQIAVIGSANVDLTTFNDEFPRPGQTIFGKKFDLGFGGKGANQAVAARKCGANVAKVAKFGGEQLGPATIKNFESQGINAKYVKIVQGVLSGVAPIFVEPNGQNRIIVIKGANDTLSPEDVDAAAPLLRKASAIVLQFEIPLPTVYYAVRFAHANGIRSIVNPAPALPVDLQQLATADYFIPNESEAEAITGLPVHSVDHAKKCAAYLLSKGIRRVVLTLGERGCLLAAGSCLLEVPDFVELVPAFKVRPVDTTGAGDAFIGSFAVFLGEGFTEMEALSRANLYAALSTTKVGTQKSFCTRAEFEREWLNRGAYL